MRIGGVAKWAARQVLHHCGGLAAARRRSAEALRILVYHRFPEAFAPRLGRHCEHLRAHYRPVSMSEAARWLAGGDPLPPRAVAITVDDGYRDFYQVAWPVFARYELPVTMYLATGFVDGRVRLWTDQVRYMCEHAGVRAAELTVAGRVLKLSLGFPQLRRATAASVNEALKRVPNAERLRVLKELPRALAADFSVRPPQADAPLAWDQVRELFRGGLVEFGAHTVTHPILSRLEDQTELCVEIAGSKRRIEDELRSQVAHFCYPNGGADDISDAAVAMVRKAGYATAVTMTPGLNVGGADAFLLNRVPVDSGYADAYFRELAAGLHL